MSDLFSELRGRGEDEKIKNTVDRIMKHTNWDDYIRNHPFDGTLINPYSIKKIVEDYYINNPRVPIERRLPPESLRVPSAHKNDDYDIEQKTPKNNDDDENVYDYELIEKTREPTGPYDPFQETKRFETWYTYRVIETGEIIKTKEKLHKEKLHGGKRKSRRNQKSKKSSKKSSKKLRKSIRRR